MISERNSYDVCIVGGGVAGSTLAYNLSSEIESCLIEKKPRSLLGSDPCGNAVHSSWFKGDVRPNPSDFNAVSNLTRSIRFHLDGELMATELPPRRKGIVIDKSLFVKGALDAAINRGVDFVRGKAAPVFEDGTIKMIKVNGHRIEADTYVDASGIPATLRSNFYEVPEDCFFKGYREVIDSKPDFESWQVFQDHPDCAFWAFPQGDKVNLGGSVFRNEVDLEKQIYELKEKMNLTDKVVLDSGYGLIQSSRPIRLVYGDLVAIGDAGLTVNPVTGGGIGPSVMVANMLAKTINRGENLENFQKLYSSKIAKDYERKFWLSRLFLKLQKYLWKYVAKWAFKKFYG